MLEQYSVNVGIRYIFDSFNQRDLKNFQKLKPFHNKVFNLTEQLQVNLLLEVKN